MAVTADDKRRLYRTAQLLPSLPLYAQENGLKPGDYVHVEFKGEWANGQEAYVVWKTGQPKDTLLTSKHLDRLTF